MNRNVRSLILELKKKKIFWAFLQDLREAYLFMIIIKNIKEEGKDAFLNCLAVDII